MIVVIHPNFQLKRSIIIAKINPKIKDIQEVILIIDIIQKIKNIKIIRKKIKYDIAD